MPSSVDPERLAALGAALDPLQEAAREGAEETLGHFPETGDRETQTAVDGLLEQLADTLRAIDAEAGELAARLRIAAQSAASSNERVRDDLGGAPGGALGGALGRRSGARPDLWEGRT
jgi:hypothetical protein